MMHQQTTPTAPRKTRRDRQRSTSSLSGMMMGPEDPFTTQEDSSSSSFSYDERQALQDMTLQLRRAKRLLLLRSAAEPANNVDRLREILLQLSVETDDPLTRVRSSSVASSSSTSTTD